MFIHTFFNEMNINFKYTKNLISSIFIFYGLVLFAQYNNPQIKKVDILSYQFKININDSTDQIFGHAKIKIHPLTKITNFNLDFDKKTSGNKGMKIHKILLNGKEFNRYKFEKNKISFFISRNINKDFTIEIFYSGIPKDGLYISRNKYGSRTFFGDNWPNRAHYWLPVIDHPSDKALVSFEISAPEHYEVVASGKFISRIKNKGKIIWKYQSEVPYPTKVMVFGAADFNIKNYEIFHNIPISGWIYKNSPLKGLDDYQPAVEILKFYDSIIGPYSYKKLANVQSKTRFGGMENAGNIFYNEKTVDGTSSTENLIAHEVGHQWFGNSVTEKNWSDIWLSEGFATYLTDLFIEHKYGKKAFEKRMKMERDKIIRYNLFKRNPVVYTEKERLFNLLNPNSYEKGAWVLHMLRQKIGDKNFFKLLKDFYKKYRNKNASTTDFINLSEKISGMNLQEFFQQWLYRSGIPELRFETKKDKNFLYIIFHQEPPYYQLNFPIEIEFPTKKYFINFPVDKEKNIYKIPLNKLPKNYKILYDPEVKILYK